MSQTAIASGLDLSAWRGRLGWSVPQAADELRILAPSLRNLEAGRKAASPMLLRLAEALEQLASAPPAGTVAAPARRRVPKPTLAVPDDPFLAALQRIKFREHRPEVLALLRTEVALRAADPGAGEDGSAYWARDREWHQARIGGLVGPTTAPLRRCAELVEWELARAAAQ